MKKIFTLLIAIFIANFSYAQVFCDDFEAYPAGSPIAETSPSWATWGSISAPTPPYADDANGKKIAEREYTLNGNSILPIQTQSFSKGLYNLSITTKEQVISKSFIVQ